VIVGLGLWSLTPLPPIFQLYRGGQFYWWRKLNNISVISLWSVLLVEKTGVPAEITDLLRDCVFETTCVTYSYLFNIESYNVDHNKVSISGISSGAAMATQMHVIHSADIMGVGLIAGGKSFNVKVTGA